MSRSRLLGVALAALLAASFAASRIEAADEPANPPANPSARPREPGRELGLLRSEVVAKDLDLTDDQKSALKTLGEDVRKQMTALRDSLKDATPEQRHAKHAALEAEIDKKVDAVLNDKQEARLNEIRLQVRGPAALTDKEVADALKLSADQVKALADLAAARRTALHGAFEAVGSDRTAARDKIAQVTKDSAEKMLAVLTADQRDQFAKMQGKKLDLGTAPFGSFGGPGRRSAGSNAKPDSK